MKRSAFTYDIACRFRRFSRRGYAAFASLHRCVTIGVVSRDVADCQMSKSSSVLVADIRRVDGCCVSGGYEADGESLAEAGRLSLLERLLAPVFFTTADVVVSAADVVRPAGGSTVILYHTEGAVPDMLVRHPLFCVTYY